MAHFRKSIGLLVLLVFGQTAQADDWPQWRGPERDGIWRETGIIARIGPAGLPLGWIARIGNGYSAPSVAGGRVFVTDHVFEPEFERILAFDQGTGEPLWSYAYAVDYKNMEYGNGPRAAPLVHDGRVYSLGTQGHLCCLDAASGELLWGKELARDFNAQNPTYGVSASPLVVGDLLIVCAGGQPDSSVVALDRRTGEMRWHALEDRPAYSSPITIKMGGVEQLVVWTADTVTGFNPTSGEIYWQEEWRASFDPAQMVATPVDFGERLLLMGAWGRGSRMLQLDPARPTASVLWKTPREPTTTHTTPIFQDDGHFYGILSDGSLACLRSDSGEKVWSTLEPTGRRMGSAHLVRHGDRVFLFNHTGHLILARLSPEGYEERGRCLVVEPTAGYRAQDR